jgi:hypothetical protein
MKFRLHKQLCKRYREKHLWVVGYFVRTTGNVTDQLIKDYIEKHQPENDCYGDVQVKNSIHAYFYTLALQASSD